MSKSKFTKILSAIATVITSLATHAQTYYVSPSGNDNATGTSPSSAWKTITKINGTVLSPGAHVLFEGGQTFSGSLSLDHSDGNDPLNPVVISSYGSGKAIISSGTGRGFYAYNAQGITISNLIFDGTSTSSNTADGIFFYMDLSSNVRLDKITINNVEVRNYGKTGITLYASNPNSGFKDVLIDSVHVHHIRENGIVTGGYTSQNYSGWSHQNVIVRNTEVNNVTGYADPNTHRGSGIMLGQVDNGLVEKSAAHHNGSGNTHCGGPGGIWAWDCNNITIQSCESYLNSSGTGCDGLGFDLDGGVTNSLMQYNYSHDNDGAGYLLGQYDYARPWSNNIVRYNISENDGRTNAGGFTLFKGPGTTMAGCKIYNNTVYMTPSTKNANVGAFTIITWNTGMTGIEVYNNIFQTTGGTKFIDVPSGYSAKFVGNLYWPSGGTFKINYQGHSYSNISTWRTATGNEQNGSLATGLTADPNLQNVGTGQIVFPNATTQLNAYKLSTNSPAINAGINLAVTYSINVGTKDFFSDSVFVGTAPDIGASESNVGGMTTAIADAPASEEIVCYPNPIATGEPVYVKGAELPYSAHIVSVSGQLLWEQKDVNAPEYPIPTAVLPPGQYILVIENKRGQRKAHKMIVQ